MLSRDRADALVGAGAPRDRLAQSLGDPRAATRRDVHVAWLAGAVAALAGGAVFNAALRARLASDFVAHIGYTLDILHGRPPRAEFLLFVSNALFAGFSTDMWWLELSLTCLLALAIGAKVWLSLRFAAAERRATFPTGDAGSFPAWGAAAVLFCSVAASLPVAGHRYLGQIPPNVWHNSTTIFLMPFALGLFWTTLCFLRTGSTRWLWWSAPLFVLNLAAKPSFLLCLVPAFGLLVLLRFRLTAPSRRAALLLAGAGALLAGQTAYMAIVDPVTATDTGIVWHPLYVWHAFSANIPLSMLSSLVFPLTALTLGGAAVRDSLAVRYALLLLVVGVAEYALLTQPEPAEVSGDFTWQAIIAMAVLFLALVSALVPWYERRLLGIRQLAIAAAFLVQIVAGVLYLQHWFATANFY